MIVGEVDPRRHSIVALAVRGPGAQEVTVRLLLDSGFNGELTLPLPMVESLGLVLFGKVYTTLADGGRVEVPIYSATVVWDGVERDVNVVASGRQPLLGTALLHGHRLTVEIVDGGRVTIEPL